jgi:hypothetical protein
VTRIEADRMAQEPQSLVWRLILTLVAWSTLTACSLVLTGIGAIGLGMILHQLGVGEVARLKIYVVFYALTSPLAILVAFRWFR